MLRIVGWLHRKLTTFVLGDNFREHLKKKHILLEVCWPGHCGNQCTHRVFSLPTPSGSNLEGYACQDCFMSTRAQQSAEMHVWSSSSIHKSGVVTACCMTLTGRPCIATMKLQYRQWVFHVCRRHLKDVKGMQLTWEELGRSLAHESKASKAEGSSVDPPATWIDDTQVAAAPGRLPSAFSLLKWHEQVELVLTGLWHTYFRTSRVRRMVCSGALLLSWAAGAVVAGVWRSRVGYLGGINTSFQTMVVFLVVTAFVQTIMYANWKVSSLAQDGVFSQWHGLCTSLYRTFIFLFELVDVGVLATFAPLFVMCIICVVPAAVAEVKFGAVRFLLKFVATVAGAGVGCALALVLCVLWVGQHLLDPGLLALAANVGVLGGAARGALWSARGAVFGVDDGWWPTHVLRPALLLKGLLRSCAGWPVALVVLLLWVVSLVLASAAAFVRAMVVAPALFKPTSRAPMT